MEPSVSEKKQCVNIRTRAMVFTLNNPELSPEQLEEILKGLSPKCYAFQKEKAPTTGTIHYQGYIGFKNACWINAFKAKVPGVWCQAAVKHSAAWNYATKEDETKVEGPWTFGAPPRNDNNKGGANENIIAHIKEIGLQAAVEDGVI